MTKRSLFFSVRFAFEPHGEETGAWEAEWVLALPTIEHHYKNLISGWRKGSSDLPMMFSARTAKGAIDSAIEFVKEIQEYRDGSRIHDNNNT